MRLHLSLLTGMLLSAPALADSGAIIAALADEAAECRYFSQLCEEARTARAAAVEAENAVEAEKKNQAAPGRAQTAWATKSKADRSKADGAEDERMNRWALAHARWVKAHNEAAEAAKVLATKHAEAPACLATCQDEVGRSD